MALVQRSYAFLVAHPRWLRGLWEVLLETLAVSVIVVAVLLFFRENIANNTIYYENDTQVFYYPVMSELAESLRAGHLSLWSPYILNGFPFFADGEAGALYPINYLILTHVPIEQAFLWLTVIRFGLASVFMYAYARSMGLVRIAGLAAAAVFGFGGFSAAQLHHMNLVNTAAWLPLILFFFELALRTKGYLRYGLVVLSGVALGISSVGVHVQVTLMILLFLGIYVPFRIFFFSWLPAKKTTTKKDPVLNQDQKRDVSPSGAAGGGPVVGQPEPAGPAAAEPVPSAPVARPEVVLTIASDEVEGPEDGAPEELSWKILETMEDGVLEPQGLSISYTVPPSSNGKTSLRRGFGWQRIRPKGGGEYKIYVGENSVLSEDFDRSNPRHQLAMLVRRLDGWRRRGVDLFLEALFGFALFEERLIDRLGDAVVKIPSLLRRLPQEMAKRATLANLLDLGRRAASPVAYLVGKLVGKSVLAAWTGGLMLFVGLGLAAPQLLPEYELGNFSFRAGAVPYNFAVSYAMTPFNLVTLLFPFFFRDTSGRYWGLWSGWETAIYAGITPLFLAVIAVACARSRRAIFFAAVAIASLIIAMGDYIPWNLHRLLYQLKGFDQMRVPARFSFLFLFSMAALSGIGLHWLVTTLRPERRWWFRTAPSGGKRRSTVVFSTIVVLAIPVVVAMPLLMDWFSVWLNDNRDQAYKLIAERYLSLRNIGFPMKPAEVFDWLQHSLSLGDKKVIVTLALFVGSILVLLLWDRFRRLGFLWKFGIVLLIAVDMYLFAKSFHPVTSVQALTAPTPAMSFIQTLTRDGRVYTIPGARDQPNRLSLLHVEDFSGYSSLQFQRQAEYQAHAEMIDNRMLDLANVRYIVRSKQYVPTPSYKDTQFSPLRPLFEASSHNASSSVAFAVDGLQTTEVRLVGNLAQAVDIPQGAKIGEVIVTDVSGYTRTVDLKAGINLSEGFYDRPDVVGKVQHQQAEVAHRFSSMTATGIYSETLYYTGLWIAPIGAPVMKVSRLEIRYTYPTGVMRIHGVDLYDTLNWKSKNLRRYDKANYKLIYQDDQEVIYENLSVLPRAFLVPTVAKVKSDMTMLFRMSEGDFDPQKVALLEVAKNQADPVTVGIPEWISGTQVLTGTALGTAKIVDNGTDEDPEKVVVQVDAKQPALLYLADSYYPGWNAYVDGQKEDVYRANYLFRAVYTPAGQHRIEFRYEPVTFAAGKTIALWVLPAAIGFALIIFVATLLAKGILWLFHRFWKLRSEKAAD